MIGLECCLVKLFFVLGNFFMIFFFVVCCSFSKSTFSKNTFRNTIRVSNSLDPDQAWHCVRPELGPNCLQRLTTDNTDIYASVSSFLFWFINSLHARIKSLSHSECNGVKSNHIHKESRSSVARFNKANKHIFFQVPTPSPHSRSCIDDH